MTRQHRNISARIQRRRLHGAATSQRTRQSARMGLNAKTNSRRLQLGGEIFSLDISPHRTKGGRFESSVRLPSRMSKTDPLVNTPAF